jgi:hypothetical protein
LCKRTNLDRVSEKLKLSSASLSYDFQDFEATLYGHIHEYQLGTNFPAWLNAIARNLL